MQLSAREREVLGMLALGPRTTRLVRNLFHSDSTVKVYRQVIDRKLDVAKRAEAVEVAYRQRVVTLDRPLPPVADVT